MGSLSTVIEFAVFNLLVFGAGVDAVPAKVMASLVALINAYFGNREWAFRHRRGRTRTREMVLFLAVNAACTVLGAGIVAVGVAVAGSDGPVILNLINLVSVGVVVIVRFALYHYLVFPDLPPRDVPRPQAAE